MKVCRSGHSLYIIMSITRKGLHKHVGLNLIILKVCSMHIIYIGPITVVTYILSKQVYIAYQQG